jgi:predicted Rdx family selenoprotein
METILEAGRLKRELKARGFEPQMRWAGMGVFDVRVDGETVYSRQRDRKWPDAGEIAGKIRARSAAG